MIPLSRKTPTKTHSNMTYEANSTTASAEAKRLRKNRLRTGMKHSHGNEKNEYSPAVPDKEEKSPRLVTDIKSMEDRMSHKEPVLDHLFMATGNEGTERVGADPSSPSAILLTGSASMKGDEKATNTDLNSMTTRPLRSSPIPSCNSEESGHAMDAFPTSPITVSSPVLVPKIENTAMNASNFVHNIGKDNALGEVLDDEENLLEQNHAQLLQDEGNRMESSLDLGTAADATNLLSIGNSDGLGENLDDENSAIDSTSVLNIGKVDEQDENVDDEESLLERGKGNERDEDANLTESLLERNLVELLKDEDESLGSSLDLGTITDANNLHSIGDGETQGKHLDDEENRREGRLVYNALPSNVPSNENMVIFDTNEDIKTFFPPKKVHLNGMKNSAGEKEQTTNNSFRRFLKQPSRQLFPLMKRIHFVPSFHSRSVSNAFPDHLWLPEDIRLSRKNILKRPMPIPVPGTKKPSKAPQMIPGKDALTETAPRRRLFFRSKSEIREKELDLQGISVAYLKKEFLQEVREAGLDEDSAIYDIEDLRDHDNNGVIRRKGEDSICPIDNKIGTSYVHALGMEPYVGKANFMLSYAWKYPIGEIVGALEQKCESDGLDESTTYVWICCLCINQHRVVESKKLGLVVSFETFRDKFKSRVIDIGNVWAMMSPWEDPEYIKRAWCLLELFYASKSKWSHTWLSFLSDNVNVDIIMPPKERNNFIQGLRNNGASNHLNKIFELLANTRVQDAEASNPDDKDKILELIKEGPGYTEFNITVNDLIRNWVIQIASDEVQVAERVKVANQGNKPVAHEYANTLNNFGILLRKVGERGDALDLFQRALDIFENIYERNHADVAQSINNVAEVLCDMGKIDEALKLHEEALAIRKSWFEGDHEQENQVALAQSFDNVGKGLCQQGRLDEALEMHKQALNIYLKLYRHGMGKPYVMDAARSVGNVAIVKHQQKELDEALKLHQKALSMRKDIYKYGHPDIASSLTQIANVHRDLKHYQEALKETKESSEILNTVYGTNHTETLQIRQLKRRNKVEFIVIRALMIVTLVLSAATCLVLSIFNFFSLFASCLVDAGTGV